MAVMAVPAELSTVGICASLAVAVMKRVDFPARDSIYATNRYPDCRAGSVTRLADAVHAPGGIGNISQPERIADDVVGNRRIVAVFAGIGNGEGGGVVARCIETGRLAVAGGVPFCVDPDLGDRAGGYERQHKVVDIG